MAEMMVDNEHGVVVLDEAGVDLNDAFKAFAETEPELAAMVRWHTSSQPSREARESGMLERDRYVVPGSYFDQIRTAQHAAEYDDVVAAAVESTEALAFSRVSLDTDDEDETDVWNQIGEDIDLDARLREVWREDFTIGSAYCAVWYGVKDFKVRGKSKDTGITRKKTFKSLVVPRGISVLDPLKVIPVGNTMFGREELAYSADRGEHDIIQAVMNGDREDPLIRQLLAHPYEPDETERRLLAADDLPADRLWLMNPERVFRHSSTRSHYNRFAPVRMKSLFEILDLKRQLRGRDRAHLLGAMNYIVLIKKGSSERPAKPAEIENLQRGVRRLAQIPVIVGDDRLSIEIITPKNDNTLEPALHNGLDARLASRLYGLLMTGNFSAGAKGDDSLKLAKFMAKGLESRRAMIAKSFERSVFTPTYEKNDAFTERPHIRFHPKRIALDFDPAFVMMLQDLRDRGDLSRESMLEEVDFDQYTEYKRRTVEAEVYDDTFTSNVVNPWGGGNDSDSDAVPADPRAGGRRGGGNHNGGGSAPGSGQGQAPKNPGKKSDGRDRPGRD